MDAFSNSFSRPPSLPLETSLDATPARQQVEAHLTLRLLLTRVSQAAAVAPSAGRSRRSGRAATGVDLYLRRPRLLRWVTLPATVATSTYTGGSLYTGATSVSRGDMRSCRLKY
jgi:hypothetical protein